jgi:serine/threonine protein kinase
MHLGINDNRQEDDALENGKKIDNYYYNFNDVIGKGNFSQVFRGVDHTTNKYVAIKVVNFSSFTSTVAEQLLKNEVNILKELDHENVVKCLDVFKSKNNCYIVTELY